MALLINSTVQSINNIRPNGEFLLFGESIQLSGDLNSWTNINPLTGKTISAVLKSHDKQLLILNNGVNNEILISIDGINWDEYIFNETGTITGIAYDTNNSYVMIGWDYDTNTSTYTGKILHSTDGITWTNLTNLPIVLSMPNSVRYANGHFTVLSYEGNTPHILSSTDGLNWTVATISPVFVGATPTYYNSFSVNNILVLTGLNNDTSTLFVLTSTDGLNWTYFNGLANDTIESIIYAQSQYYVLTGTGSIFSTTDFTNYTFITQKSYVVANSLTYENGLFIVLTTTTNTHNTIVNISEDLNTWIPSNIITGHLYHIAYMPSTGNIILGAGSVPGAALLDSPDFIGIPTVPTAPSGTNTTQIASTAFVQTAITNVNTTGGLTYTPVNVAGDTMLGTLTLFAAPTSDMEAATKKYVDDHAGNNVNFGYTPLNKAGDYMTGLLTLSGAPTIDLHAATKKYVDDLGNLKVSISGSVMTGLLTLSGAPTADLHASTKKYVDDKVGTKFVSASAPNVAQGVNGDVWYEI